MATIGITGQAVNIQTEPPQPGWRIKVMLPALELQAHFTYDQAFNFSIVLPKLVATGYGGGVVAIPLPMLKVAMGMTIPNNIRFNAVLPQLQGNLPDVEPATTHMVWIGSVGMVWRFAITLPLLQTAGKFGGWRFAITLPALAGGAVGGRTMQILPEYLWTFDIRLPRLKASAEFSTREPGYVFFGVLPALVATHGLSGAVSLPSLRAFARMAWVQTTVLRRGWAMNLQNNAVTEFAGFDFRAMAFAYNQHYGIGFDGGLYRMGGDNDNGNPIAWTWESGLSDFGVNAQKGLLALYVDGLFENGATFSVQSDTARRIYGHRAKGSVVNHQPHRVPLGRGVRTRNIAIGMADENGGYLELDKITPEYVITPRNL